MEKLKSLFLLFRKGAAVANPQKWKERQITVTLLAAFIVALIQVLTVFGVALPVDTETANMLAAGVIGIVNVVLTMTTSTVVGLPQAEPETKVVEKLQDIVEHTEVKHVEAYENYKRSQTNKPEDNLYIN